jgi:hypothetical protein
VAEGALDSSHGLLCDVFVEGAGRGARGEDSLNGAVVEGAEGRGVGEGGIDIGGGIALAQKQDLARLMGPDTSRAGAHQAKEGGGALAHLLEGAAQLVELERALALRKRVQAGRVEPQALAARRELVAGDAAQVGGVDEELALGNADGDDIGDMLVGYGVFVAIPCDEASIVQTR